MEKEFIKIAHLSDLHFTPEKEGASCYKSVQTDLLNLKPDLIVVTGDLADNERLTLNNSNLRKSFEIAKNFLISLCNGCNLEQKERLFVVPGNHDYRYKGCLNFWSKVSSEIFKEVFKDFFQSKYIPDINLIVGCFDSNITNHTVNFSTGEVLIEEFNRFNEWKSQYKEFATAKKIALLHHHPMPICRAETTGDLIDRPEFLLLRNGGTFMREMLKNGIRLIFHGHEHQRGVSKASFPIGSDIFRNIGVISAASIGKKKKDEEFSFNVVDYYDNGKVKVNYRVRRGEGTYEDESKEPLELFDYEEARFLCFQDSKSQTPTIAKRLIYTYKILKDKDKGNLEGHTLIESWVSNQELQCEKIDAELRSMSGMFNEPPKYNVILPIHGQKIEWKPQGSPDTNGLQRGVIIFDPPLNKEPIIAESTIEVPNAFFFTKEDRSEVTGGRSERESVSQELKNYTAEQLTFHVQFPSEFTPGNPRVEVTDLNGNLQFDETRYCQKRFNYSKTINSAILSINFPLFQRSYNIVWDLPSESEMKIEGISQSELAKATEIKNRLIKLKPIDSDAGKIRNCLENIYKEIINANFLFSGKKDDYLEVCIVVYNKSIGKLQYVAYFCPKIKKLSDSNIWNLQMIKGQPVSGLAFSGNETAIMFCPKEPFPKDPYIRKPDCLDACNKYFTTIVAFPLDYPLKSGNIVGFLELASCSNESGLFRLSDKVKRESFYDTVLTKFFPDILNAIDILV